MTIESNVTRAQIEEYTALGFWDKWTFCDYVKRWGSTFPEKEALIDSRRRLTWSELRTMMDRMALNFLELGLKRGDLVVVQSPNSIEAVVTEFALARIGACVVPVPMQWREHELDYVIRQTETPAVIIPAEYKGFDYAAMLRDSQTRHPSFKHIIALGASPPPGTVSFEEMSENDLERRYTSGYLDKNFKIDGNDVLTLCYTSGTEAEPKGCPRTHNHWKCFERSAFLGHLMQNVNDRVVISLPWFNLFGQSVGILPMTMVGGTLILLDGFHPATMAETIAKEKATLYAGVPAMHISLLNYSKLDQYDMSSLRVIASGGAPCPTDTIKQLMERFGCLVWNGFGSNEGYLNVTEVGMGPELVSTTMGTRQLYSQVKIVDKKGHRLGVGEVGEFCQKAPFLIAGYYKRPDLNTRKWDNEGFYHTGDACYLDEHGFYRFVSRISDMIIRAGMNVSAEEVEAVLYRHPKVLHAAVVAMPASTQGERICAYIELKPDAETVTRKEIRDFMGEQKVARYKWPDRIEIVRKLPRTPTGKVLKKDLREDIAAKVDRAKRQAA